MDELGLVQASAEIEEGGCMGYVVLLTIWIGGPPGARGRVHDRKAPGVPRQSPHPLKIEYLMPCTNLNHFY